MPTDINPKAAEFEDYRRAIRELCATFGSEYWRAIEERSEYPEAFVKALTDAGFTRFRRVAETPFNNVYEARP